MMGEPLTRAEITADVESMSIRVAGIVPESVVDGPGLRFVVFAQGCHHHCPGCHNPETHDVTGGAITSVGEIWARITRTRLIRGITLSGGEPFLQAAPLAALASLARGRGLDIVTYSGYTYEQLQLKAVRWAPYLDLLEATDYLIDGPYVESEGDLGLKFRGSRNQRILDIRHSLAARRPVPLMLP